MSVMFAVPALAQDYDLVITNGRVMDPETLFDGVANVGIKDGRIAAISKKPDNTVYLFKPQDFFSLQEITTAQRLAIDTPQITPVSDVNPSR